MRIIDYQIRWNWLSGFYARKNLDEV
jgi:hypothetical protein